MPLEITSNEVRHEQARLYKAPGGFRAMAYVKMGWQLIPLHRYDALSRKMAALDLMASGHLILTGLSGLTIRGP